MADASLPGFCKAIMLIGIAISASAWVDGGRVRPRTPGQGLAAPWNPAKGMSAHADRITVMPLADESHLGYGGMTTSSEKVIESQRGNRQNNGRSR
jgi:hypothetical protein